MMRRFVAVLSLCACGPVAAMPGDETTSSTTAEMPSASTSTDGGPSETTGAIGSTTGSEPTGTGGTTSTTSSESSEGHAFIDDPDGGNLLYECDIWTDDCPVGEKCMPWANDGGNSWNAVRCSPIAEDAKDVGEPCTVEDSGVSGLDDCVARAMCWDVDPETNEGVCVGFCTGSEANPSCSMPCDSCSIWNDGVLILCLPSCDPLAQNCTEGMACWPLDGEGFHCFYAGQKQGVPGDPCEGSAWDCEPGLACIEPERVPGCESGTGCCASFCDTAEEDSCPQATTCVPWFGEGESPPCISQTIGVCAIPEGA